MDQVHDRLYAQAAHHAHDLVHPTPVVLALHPLDLVPRCRVAKLADTGLLHKRQVFAIERRVIGKLEHVHLGVRHIRALDAT